MILQKDLLKYSLGLIIISFVYTLSPFIKIRFGILYAERIGHLATTFDNYIFERNKRNNLELAIFHINDSISNTELLRLWKKEKNIYFSRIAKIVFHTIKKFKFKSKIIIDWDEMETVPNKVNSSKQIIKTDKEFHSNGKAILNKYSINEPYICFTSRDDQYVNKIQDKNFYDYKNYNFKNFDKPINSLINKNYNIIRITKATNSNYKNNSNKYFFFENNRTDLSDIFLLSQSRYNVYGSFHGITEIGSIFRKKCLYLNIAPFTLGMLSTISKGSTFTPKKIYSKKLERYLKFKEMVLLKDDRHYKGNFYKDNHLEIVDNTDEEVFSIIEEFDKNFTLDLKQINSDLHNKFWNSFEDKELAKYLRNELCINISKVFLEKNFNLI